MLDAIAGADLVLIAPSNPVVSIGTDPGGARASGEALRADSGAGGRGVAGDRGSAPVRGHADKCLAAIGVECSAEGVGRHYGARSDGGLLDAFLIAEGDTADDPGRARRRTGRC